MSCNAVVDLEVSGQVAPNVLPYGYGPASLQAAYHLPASMAGAGQTIAIVDAYDLPTAEADLATYRAEYGLPACTSASGCFRKVNQSGGTTPPAADVGWGEEIALDLDMVSAGCPKCSIILVEAASEFMPDLGAAENTAVRLGATAVSNSWGGDEYPSETADDLYYFNHPGVAITFSAGDSGYGMEYPAASPRVIAVGGTSLTAAAGIRGYAETAWSGSGSGCSVYEPKPAWQTDSGCTRRSVNDVSMVADPNTGVAVYDSTPGGGWMVFGGTSAAAPLVAASYELSRTAPAAATPAATLYTHPAAFFDVTSGTNGSCVASYLCNSRSGYDGPTGLGTPNGIAAFVAGSPPAAPTGVTAVAGKGTATVGWQAPVSNGGQPIIDYVVTPRSGSGALPARTFTSAVTTQLISGLTNGTSYTFTVAAVTAWGSGPASAPSPAVTPNDAVAARYLQLGGTHSYLGAAVGSEATLAGGGLSQAYQGGSIYWSAATGAHVVHGAILGKYLALHAAAGVLGYPTTDETPTPDGVGRYNHFSKGAIYWTRTLGAHAVVGPIHSRWAALHAERGPLGYPTSDQYAVFGGWRSSFQHGFILLNGVTGGTLVFL